MGQSLGFRVEGLVESFDSSGFTSGISPAPCSGKFKVYDSSARSTVAYTMGSYP